MIDVGIMLLHTSIPTYSVFQNYIALSRCESAVNHNTIGILDNVSRSVLCRCAGRGERRLLRGQVNECTLACAVTARKKSNIDQTWFVMDEI